MKHLRVTLEVCGAAVLLAALALGWERPSAAQVSKEAQAVKLGPSYTQMNDPNFKLIVALQDRVDKLEARLAALRTDYTGHTHRYVAPSCGYENLATFKNELAGGATNVGVCIITPALVNHNGSLTTAPTK